MSRANSAIKGLVRRLRSWDLFAILLLGAWHFIYFFPVTIGQKVFIDGDILYSFLPFHTELARALAEGRLPLWTPGIQAGFPLFAEGEVGALYPPNLIFHLWLPAPTALSYTILFNWSWASIGMYLLCRCLNLRVAGAVLAAWVFGASGFMIARAPHVPLVAVASWLPWLLLFQVKYWRAKWENQRTVGWLLLICLSLAMQFLAGSPPIAFFNVTIFVLLGALAPWVWGNRQVVLTKSSMVEVLRWLPQGILLTVLPMILGAGLAAIQLAPTAELLLFSTRGQELGEAFFTSFSIALSDLTQFVFPFQQLGAPTFYNTEYWSYFGLLPLMLAGLALLLRRDFRTGTFFLIALGALVLSLGGYTPLYVWLYNVPLFNRFRVPARFLFLFTLAGAYLAGAALQELRNRLGGSKAEWKQVALGMVFAILVLFVVDQAYAQPSAFWLDVWTWLPWVLLFASIVIAAAAARRLVTRATLAIVVVGLTALDLSAFAAPFLADSAQMISPSDIVGIPRTVRVMDETQSAYRFLSDKWPSTTRASIRTALLTNLSLLYGKQSATAYVPSLALQRNVEYSQSMSSAMRNLLNIRYYLIPLEPLPWDNPPSEETEPEIGLTPDLLRQQPSIPPTHAVEVKVVSYTDQSGELPNGFLAGEVVLTLDTGKQIALPIRLGIETADWAYDGIAKIGKVNHSQPANSTSFLAYLATIGSEFQGHKYSAQFDIAASESPVTVTSVGVRSFLPDAGLKVESVFLIDEKGHSVSLASLLGRNNLALVFRSHTAAMWENQDVLPRAFLVHHAQLMRDDQILARLREPGFRPDQVALLSDGQTPETSNAVAQAQTADQVAITDYKSDQVTISVRTDRAGYLVLADSWYPGWEVRVDGQPAPIYRADYIFRAVLIEPGQHSVVFEYHPASLVWGAWISGLSAVVLVLLSLVSFRRGNWGAVP